MFSGSTGIGWILPAVTSKGRDVHLHVRIEFILLSTSHSEETGWHRGGGKIGEVIWAREVGCQFLFNFPLAVFVLFWTASKNHFLILLKGRLNVIHLSLKIQEQLWYFKNTKNIYFHEILTVSLQTYFFTKYTILLFLESPRGKKKVGSPFSSATLQCIEKQLEEGECKALSFSLACISHGKFVWISAVGLLLVTFFQQLSTNLQ